jgi:hypothetical protein
VVVVFKSTTVNDFRITVGIRYPNYQIEPKAGCLPILEVILPYLKDTSEYTSLDGFKGFMKKLKRFVRLSLTLGCSHEDAAHAVQAGMYKNLGDLLILLKKNCYDVEKRIKKPFDR